MENLLYYVLFLPLLGAVINGLLGKKFPKKLIAFVGNITVFSSFAMSIALFFYLGSKQGDAIFTIPLFKWINTGYINIEFRLLLDHLSAIMLLVVTGVSSFIHLYSIGYMKDDPSFYRFFSYLNLFVFSMLLLILGENILLLFVGWEGVGLCSYLLIGFWFTDMEKAIAGKKAFIVNRIGDFGFLLGIFLIAYFTSGKLSFLELKGAVSSLSPGIITAVTLLLFVGATGKSAQIPLYVWLPDAMAGPTPVSALIHAATMVTAGVYMIARLNFLYVLSPVSMAVVAGVGALTAFFAATIGVAQNDIKKVLAYSTISQLGYMFLGVGVGAFSAAIFHLMTHAFFKALLFLGAGAVIHALGGIQDIRKMGALSKKLPVTHITFLIATLAIAGIPFFSGFFSKDEILWRAFSNSGLFPRYLSILYYILGLTGAIITAFYMFRLYFLTFGGNTFRGDKKVYEHLHKPDITMKITLVVLAVLSAIGGFVGIPHEKLNIFEHYLSPVFEEAQKLIIFSHSHTTEYLFALISVVAASLGIFLAYQFYAGKQKDFPQKFATRFKGLYELVKDKYRIDELYNFLFVKPFVAISSFLHRIVDVILIDLLGVNGAAFSVKFLGRGLRFIQTGNLQQYLAVMIFVIFVVLVFIL